jgi:hypothetical protein
LSTVASIPKALQGLPDSLQNCEGSLADTQAQLAAAKGEVGRPFPQEQEYKEKSLRLKEVNALLNMDEKDHAVLDASPDEGDAEPAPKVAGLER